jgi:hypothetical protein
MDEAKQQVNILGLTGLFLDDFRDFRIHRTACYQELRSGFRQLPPGTYYAGQIFIRAYQSKTEEDRSMIKLELFAEDRGLWRSRVVVAVMTMWHYYCWNSRQSGMPFNKQ